MSVVGNTRVLPEDLGRDGETAASHLRKAVEGTSVDRLRQLRWPSTKRPFVFVRARVILCRCSMSSRRQMAFRESAAAFARDVVAPRAAAIDETGQFPIDVIRAAGLARLVRRDDSHGLGRSGPRLSELRAGDRSHRAGERHRCGVAVGDQFARRRAHCARRTGATERSVAAASRVRRGHRCVRALRARGRHRRGQSEDAGDEGRARLPHHGSQGLGRECRRGNRRWSSSPRRGRGSAVRV